VDGETSIETVDPRRADAREALTQYLDEIIRRVPDITATPGDVDDVDDYIEPAGRFLLVTRGDTVIGCGALRSMRPGVGEVKRMWVHSDARGAGVGGRILEALVEQSRAMGHTTLLLDTNGILVEALALYGKHGFEPIERYNDNPSATHFLRKTL
jgi:GNAT superfamily N-acetyltransferase